MKVLRKRSVASAERKVQSSMFKVQSRVALWVGNNEGREVLPLLTAFLIGYRTIVRKVTLRSPPIPGRPPAARHRLEPVL